MLFWSIPIKRLKIRLYEIDGMRVEGADIFVKLCLGAASPPPCGSPAIRQSYRVTVSRLIRLSIAPPVSFDLSFRQ